jgi:AraC-like DNA-binding protein
MKPSIEKISNKPDFGWRIQSYLHGGARFDWHYHFEYELVLHRHFEGQKFVGDYIGAINHNNLSLYGPKLPHTMVFDSTPENAKNETYIIWFSQGWINQLIQTLPELKNLQLMLDKSLPGIEFSEQLAEEVFLLLKDHLQYSPPVAVARVIEVLVKLNESCVTKRLNSYNQKSLEDSDKALKLVEKISLFIENNYRDNIKLADLCSQVHASKSTVSRLFERHFLSSFSVHLSEYRLGKACEYLVNSDKSIAIIADLVGFNNLSNFNRQFKAKKQMSPKQFRLLFAQ